MSLTNCTKHEWVQDAEHPSYFCCQKCAAVRLVSAVEAEVTKPAMQELGEPFDAILHENLFDLCEGKVTKPHPFTCICDNCCKTKQQELVSLQNRVRPWLISCFGKEIAGDKVERNHRFLEESIELVQACGCTQSEAHQLVDYVYGRPVGERHQEVGGVVITLAALCLAQELDMYACGEAELARIWTKVEQIRAKQAAKPKHSPLPTTPQPCPKCAETKVY